MSQLPHWNFRQFFFINDLQKCLVYPFMLILPKYQSYNSQSIPYVIVRRSSFSLKPYVRPSFSYITWCSYTCLHFTLTTLLVRNGYLAENKVLPKKESRPVRIRFVQVEVVCCNFSYTNFNENRSRTSLQNQLKISCTSTYFCFYYISSFRRRGHSILPSVRQKVVSVQ